MNIQLLIIDPQKGFSDPSINPLNYLPSEIYDAISGLPSVKDGSPPLFVPGADKDMERLAKFISRVYKKLDDIHVTLDSHQVVDISHPIWWLGKNNNHPPPFTIIEVDDVLNGTWRTTNPVYQKKYGLEYVEALKRNGRYSLCVWPYHCLINTPEHELQTDISKAILQWEYNKFTKVDYVPKGNNPFTEHYSGVKADVEDPEDETTQINTGLIEILIEADLIPFSGEALSHCVKFTGEDVADKFGPDNIKKIVLLEDTCSPVPGFETQADEFVQDMIKKGMQVSTSDKFLT